MKTDRKLTSRLRIENFAQIASVDLRLGDLTVLVGAQGTGKTLALEWLKAGIDGRQLARRLKDAGYVLKDAETAVDLVFGTGMGGGWSDQTSDEEEHGLVSRTFDVGEVETMIEDGRIADAATVAAFHLAERFLTRERAR